MVEKETVDLDSNWLLELPCLGVEEKGADLYSGQTKESAAELGTLKRRFNSDAELSPAIILD